MADLPPLRIYTGRPLWSGVSLEKRKLDAE